MNPHQSPSISPIEIIRSLIRNQQIIYQLSKREILARYRGSMFGIIWSFFTPLLMLIVYTIFFSVVFKAKWGTSNESSHAEYAVILFVGLILHGLLSECINRAPSLVLNQTSYVKKIIFPLEVLPWIALSSALFHAGISTFALLLTQFFLHGHIPWTFIFLPLIILPFLFIIIGSSWFLAATGVYIRDLSQTTGLITSILLFISPVFYSISMLPEKMRVLIYFNPLTVIVNESRKVLIFGELPNFLALLLYSLCSFLVAWVGFYIFQKTRKGFADVM